MIQVILRTKHYPLGDRIGSVWHAHERLTGYLRNSPLILTISKQMRIGTLINKYEQGPT